MPRAPKPKAKTNDEGPKAKKVKGGMSKMVEELVKSFSVWLDKGQSTAILPMESIDKISHGIWKVKMASWKDEGCEDVDLDLGCVGMLDETLSQLFKALERKCLTSSDVVVTVDKAKASKNKASAKLQNTSAGLVLAAIVLDLSALQANRSSTPRPQVQPKEEVVANAMAFLWHQARFALPTLLESKEKSSSEAAVDSCHGLACSLRCIHHVLAARRYCSSALPAVSLGHKAAPMAAQCVTLAASMNSTSQVLKTALATLGEASSDLLISLSGYGCADSSLQALAMTEFRRLATLNGLMAKKGLSGTKGAASPSFLALALRAIGATMLPLGLYSKQPKDLCHMAAERVTAADARAGHLAAVVVQQMLETSGSESISVLVQQLFAVVGDPFWASAPLYALRLIGALSRVAGASRAVDLECCQREEATKLLAKAAEALTRGAQEALEAEGNDNMKVLRAWASEKGTLKMKDDPLAFVVSVLDAMASEDGLWAPGSSQKPRGELQRSALAASNARCNAAALLCLNLATPVVCKKRKDVGGATPLKAPEWILKAWASHESADLSVAVCKTPSNKEIRSAIALHRQLQWKDPSSILSGARTSALECLLSLARNNPLAHVRRQALCGLSACCTADPQLIASRCVAEAVATGLQDEAAFARLASLELVAQLKCPEGEMKTAVMPRLMELRMLVRSKFSDPSVLVRRGAFRAAGVWLEECEDAKTQIHEAGEMLRRLRSEQAQIRSQALSVLERVVFCTDCTKSQMQEAVLQRLCTLHAHQGVGPAGVRDILTAHCKIEESSGAEAATAEMEGLTSCALKSLPATSKTDALELHLSLLEQLSLERPAAFHKHLNRFGQWLGQAATSGESTEATLILPIAACNILAQVLPNWAQSVSALSKQKMADTLMNQLAQLLDEESAPSSDLGQLARVVVKCLATVVEHLSTEAREMLMGHFGRSFRILSEATNDGMNSCHSQLCRHTWIMASLLEFLDSKSLDVLCETITQVSGRAAVTVLSKAAVTLLSECCLRGPAAVKPAMLPALGFALRRFPHLLAESPDGPSPLTVLKHGLACESNSTAASFLRLRTAETFAGLAACYQEAAESDGPSKKKKDNSASVGAQKLATLQPELLAVLQAEGKTIQQALRGFRCLCDLGVLHPASTLPGILCVTMAGTQMAARHARQLLLRLVEKAAPLLAQRCGTALRMAAQQLWEANEVNLYSQSWRYGPLCEAYGEFLDTKQARDQFLCNLISEILSESSEASESDASVFLLRLQLVVGVLVRLPLSKEAEVARLVHAVVQFLTLKVAPYMTLDDQEKANQIDFPPPTRATCAVAAVLHRLCVGWLDVLGADFTKQMRDSWGSTFSLSMDFDQALPVAFTRQTLPNLAGLFEKIASEDGACLLNDIEADSPLLNSHAAARALAIKQHSRKRLGKEEGKGSKLKRTRLNSKAAAEANAMSKAAANA